MELQRAFEILGLERDASPAELASAYRSLCDDIDARIARAPSLGIRRRFGDARAQLDVARGVIAASMSPGATKQVAPEIELAREEHERSWSVLGLAVGASPLDVASAYVSICVDLDNEAETAPTLVLRESCLEARAEVDEAYRACAEYTFSDDARPPSASIASDEHGARYETQVATAAFEAEPSPSPTEAAPDWTNLLEVSPDEFGDAENELVVSVPRTKTPRRSFTRILALTFSLAVMFVGGVLGYAWWTDTDLVQHMRRLAPRGPDPAVAEAQSAAEYLRRRITEERRDLQSRSEQVSDRVAGLEEEYEAAVESVEREQLAAELARARARHALASDLAELSERHIFAGSDLAVAYGKMELGSELALAGANERALEAFTEARARLELTLGFLNDAEDALGARSEALAAQNAWMSLAGSTSFETSRAAQQGRETFSRAVASLGRGEFVEATPDLHRAAQSYRVALEEERRFVISARAEAEARVEAERKARAKAEARAEERQSKSESPPDVAAAPPAMPAERAAIKLVPVPGGEFFYGCDRASRGGCKKTEEPGFLVDLPAFRIDRTEVRVTEYQRCVKEGVCSEPDVGTTCNWGKPLQGDHPVNCVDWMQSLRYCEWVGKRLPTEYEWEKAARGTDRRQFPWGNTKASCSLAVMASQGSTGCGEDSTWPVASRESGKSPYGVFDMAGNVLEWTMDWPKFNDGKHVVRGGSWRSDALPVRTTYRQLVDTEARDARIGFRCAESQAFADSAAGHP